MIPHWCLRHCAISVMTRDVPSPGQQLRSPCQAQSSSTHVASGQTSSLPALTVRHERDRPSRAWRGWNRSVPTDSLSAAHQTSPVSVPPRRGPKCEGPQQNPPCTVRLHDHDPDMPPDLVEFHPGVVRCTEETIITKNVYYMRNVWEPRLLHWCVRRRAASVMTRRFFWFEGPC